MNDVNTPPWDTNKHSQNPIDKTHIFTQPQNIFTFEQTPIQDTIDSKNTTQQNTLTPQSTTSLQQTFTTNTDQLATHNHNTPQHTALHDDSTEMIALALKYRPKTFAELVGQESVARTLCLALDSKKIANAYLFSGLRGSGKTSSARILARSLQCESGITSSPCGHCPNCIAALKGAHMDIIELDGASNRKIDDIRDLIEQTRYKPTMGRFKVFIIDEVHMLTKEAFNSLLKTLEEPPHYVKFILATTDPLKVPPTILSRTQHFRFKKIPTNALKNHLAHILQKEHVSTDNESLDMIIRNGHGSVRDTLTLLDQAIVFCQNELTTQKLADMLGSLDPKAFDMLFQALLRKNMQECVQFARSLEGYEIEMILDELSLYIKNKMLEDIPQIPPILGMRYANIINDSKAMLQLDCDSDFCLLLTILKMLEAQKIREVAHAIKQLESTQTHSQTMQVTQLAQAYIQDSTHSNNMQTTPHNEIVSTHTEQTTPHTNVANNQKETTPAIQYEQTKTAYPTQNQNITQSLQDTKEQVNNTPQHKDIQTQITQDSVQQPTLQAQATPSNTLFQTLIAKLYERDYTIGHIFEHKITFDKLDQNILYLIFYTTEEETTLLRQGYNGIMQVIKEIYGDSVKMQVQKQAPQERITQTHNTLPQDPNAYQPQDNTQITQHKNTNENTQTESTQNTQTHNTQNEQNDPALQFIAQNRDVLKSMQNELGIKDMKILSLDIL